MFRQKEDAMTEYVLSKEERLVLAWIKHEEESWLGECEGKAFDRLLELELVKVRHTFGRSKQYNRVSITEKGIEVLRGN